MSKVFFNVKYVPPTGDSGGRAFYAEDADGGILSYMTRSGKIANKENDAYKGEVYFDENGPLSPKKLSEAKKCLRTNKGNVWHAVCSFEQKDTPKVNTLDKSVRVLSRAMPEFYEKSGLQKDNVHMICCLHQDRPEHFHIHMVFFEKDAIYLNSKGENVYHKGKISLSAIQAFVHNAENYLESDQAQISDVHGLLAEAKGMGLSVISTTPTQKAVQEVLKEQNEKGIPTTEEISKTSKAVILADPKLAEETKKFFQETARLPKEQQREAESAYLHHIEEALKKCNEELQAQKAANEKTKGVPSAATDKHLLRNKRFWTAKIKQVTKGLFSSLKNTCADVAKSILQQNKAEQAQRQKNAVMPNRISRGRGK